MRRFSEKGNALFLILIAVILFGALSYTVANMMRPGGGEKIADEKASLYADEILAHGQKMRQVVQDLRISNGCEDIDLSFDDATLFPGAQFDNPNSPPDNSCDIFHPNGGGLNYIPVPEDIKDPGYSAYGFYQQYYWAAASPVLDVGTSESDLILSVRGIKRNICLAINEKVGINNPGGEPPTSLANGNTSFLGDYPAGIAISNAEISGKPVGCVYFNAVPAYTYYQVLIAR